MNKRKGDNFAKRKKNFSGSLMVIILEVQSNDDDV